MHSQINDVFIHSHYDTSCYNKVCETASRSNSACLGREQTPLWFKERLLRYDNHPAVTAGSDIERLTFYVRLWSSRHEKMTAIIESMERKARQKSMLPRTWERRSWKHVLGCREFPPFFNYTVSHNPATQLGYTLCKDIRTTCFYRIYMSKLQNTKYRQTKEVTEQSVRAARGPLMPCAARESPRLSCIHGRRETIMCCPCALLWQNRGTNDDGAERWLCLWLWSSPATQEKIIKMCNYATKLPFSRQAETKSVEIINQLFNSVHLCEAKSAISYAFQIS